MLENKKITVVLPAYNAEKTLKKTVEELPQIVDEVILVDDNSRDKTYKKSLELGIRSVKHDRNLGYGGNQKTCYNEALKLGSDVVVMVHPDYQYSPKLVGAMAGMIVSSQYDMVLGSRILGDQKSRKQAMPFWRYVSNRVLTLYQNILLRHKLTEYHTGLRAYSKEFLESIDYARNSNDFIFDNELILKAIYHNWRIGEISCPTKYDAESSSINFYRSLKYGMGVLLLTVKYRLDKLNVIKFDVFGN